MSQTFDAVVIACILLSSLTLAMEKPNLSDDSKSLFKTMDLVFMAVFTFEMIAKMISNGLIREVLPKKALMPYEKAPDTKNFYEEVSQLLLW